MSKKGKRARARRAGKAANGDERVKGASVALMEAHARTKALRAELRTADGDVRRANSLLRKLTAPPARPRPYGIHPYKPPAPSGPAD